MSARGPEPTRCVSAASVSATADMGFPFQPYERVPWAAGWHDAGGGQGTYQRLPLPGSSLRIVPQPYALEIVALLLAPLSRT